MRNLCTQSHVSKSAVWTVPWTIYQTLKCLILKKPFLFVSKFYFEPLCENRSSYRPGGLSCALMDVSNFKPLFYTFKSRILENLFLILVYVMSVSVLQNFKFLDPVVWAVPWSNIEPLFYLLINKKSFHNTCLHWMRNFVQNFKSLSPFVYNKRWHLSRTVSLFFYIKYIDYKQR